MRRISRVVLHSFVAALLLIQVACTYKSEVPMPTGAAGSKLDANLSSTDAQPASVVACSHQAELGLKG